MSYKLLSHTENGYITRCNNCNHYCIAFGTTMMCISGEEFNELKKEIQNQFGFFLHDGFHDQKIIQVLLPSQTICMILNYTELEKLSFMLAEVNLIQEVETILFNKDYNS